MSRINYKQLCKALNEYAGSHQYDKPASLRIDFTHFAPIHKAQRGRNGVGELVELQTRVIEAEAIHVDTWDRSNLITLYVRATTRNAHGFGSDRGSFVRVRDAKGKYHSMELRTAWESDDINIDRLQCLFGYESAADFAAEEFKDFAERERDRVVQIVQSKGEERDRSVQEVNFGAMRRAFTARYYRDLIKCQLDHERTEEFEKFLASLGFKLVKFFSFTDSWRAVSPSYVDQNSQGFELGWKVRGTYCTLPSTFKITKVREIKSVKLADLNVEEAGYYSHTDQMRILPEQVERVKRFASRFRSKETKVREKTLDAALKAG